MLARSTFQRNAVKRIRTDECLFLPFLYCTKTLLRYHRNVPKVRARHRSSGDDGDGDGDGRSRRQVVDSYESKKGGDQGSHLPFQSLKGSPDRGTNWYSPNVLRTQGVKERSMDSRNDPTAAPSGSSRDRRPKLKGSNRPGYIPFEHPSASARPDPYADLEGTTITPAEKKAFQSLFKLRKPASPTEHNEPTKASEKGTSSKPMSDDLETILSTAVGQISPHRQGRTIPSPAFPAPLQVMADEAAQEISPKQSTAVTAATVTKPPKRWSAASEALSKAAWKDVREVKTLLINAETDVEVWQVMCSRLLERAVGLGLDGEEAAGEQLVKARKIGKGRKNRKVEGQDADTCADDSVTSDAKLNDDADGVAPTNTKPSTRPKPTELQILSESLPINLLNILSTLTLQFPRSPLPLAVLPLIKSLGPATSTLCLSTPLYNTHLRLLWTTYTDLPAILKTLEEMDKEVYEFDYGTAALLGEIRKFAARAREGMQGDAGRVFWSLERMGRDLRALAGWERVVKERREEAALRRAAEVVEFGGRSEVEERRIVGRDEEIEPETPALDEGQDEEEGEDREEGNEAGLLTASTV